VIHIENLLCPLYLFYFHLWHIYWLSILYRQTKGRVFPVLNLLSTMPWWHMGELSYSSTFVDLGTRWRWVVSFTLLSRYLQGVYI
jgi:hypothetical protein